MLWFLLALLTALSVAARDVSVKTFESLGPFDVAAVELFWALPVLAAACALVPMPALDPTFWWLFVISLPLNGVAYILYLYAIKVSPLSLSVPFLSFTPVFMILTGYLTLGETVTGWGALGIGLIVMGSYVLNAGKVREGVIKPFTALFNEKGSWLMLIVALLYAFAAVLGKKAMQHSSPLFFSYFFFLSFNLVILALLFASGRTSWRLIRTNRAKGVWLGGLLAAHLSFHALAISMATAVYMIAVKRSSILFSVFLSWLILKEKDITTRGLGTACMFCGVLLIILLG